MPYSTLSSAALLFWKTLESYGIDPKPLFEKAGLDPDKLYDANARFGDIALFRLSELAIEASADPCFGLTMARFWHPTSAHALGYAWMASETLKDALERATRYFRIVTNKEELLLEETAQDFRLTIHNPDPRFPTPDQDYDTMFAVLINQCRLSYGEDFKVLRLDMHRPAPPDVKPFEDYFNAPIQFGEPGNVVYFDKSTLTQALPTGNAELAHAHDRVIQEYLARFNRESIVLQVRTKLVDQLSSGHATQTSIAKALHLSLRSLQRKLREEGTSYKEILDDVRRELAAQYVRHSALSINEITFLLGFSEPANFTRAFKRWQGISPSEYRISH